MTQESTTMFCNLNAKIKNKHTKNILIQNTQLTLGKHVFGLCSSDGIIMLFEEEYHNSIMLLRKFLKLARSMKIIVCGKLRSSMILGEDIASSHRHYAQVIKKNLSSMNICNLTHNDYRVFLKFKEKIEEEIINF